MFCVPEAPLELNCAADVDADACVSRTQLESDVADWLNTFSATTSDECLPLTTTYTLDGTTYPDAGAVLTFISELTDPLECGAEFTVIFAAEDNCGESRSCTASYRVPVVGPPALSGPDSIRVVCNTQETTDSSFRAFVEGFTFTTDCEPDRILYEARGFTAIADSEEEIEAAIDELLENVVIDQCGRTVDLTYTVETACGDSSITRNFGVLDGSLLDYPESLYALPNQWSQAALRLFPNPASEQLTVYFDQIAGLPARVELISLLGQVIHREQWAQLPVGAHTIDLQGVPPGSYLLRIRGEQHQLVRKVLIKR